MKDIIKKLSHFIEKTFKKLPHLPEKYAKTFAENLWWVLIVGMAVYVISVIGSIGAISVAISTANRFKGFLGIYASPVNLGPAILTFVISVAFLVISAVIIGLAIKPVKKMNKKGWDLLFIGMLINAVYVVANSVTSGIISFLPNLIGGAIGVALTAYLLNEVRVYFVEEHKTKTE